MSPFQLKEEIIKYNIQYRKGNPIISNLEYDKLLEKLKTKISNDEYSEFIKTLLEEKGKVKHKYIIGSLTKTKYGTDQYKKWITKHNINKIFMMEKVDGLSIVIEYFHGKFKQAITRGNGEYGENQTDKLKYLVPNDLENDFTGFIRAELTLTHKSFKKLKEIEPEKNHKNLRNSASGIINSKEVEKEKIKLLKIICYQIIGSEFPLDKQLTILSDYGLDVVRNNYFLITDKTETELSFDFSEWKNKADYDIDGFVLCDINYIGENVYHPEKMVAFKVDSESEITIVKFIDYSVSKQGYIKPVVNFDEIQLNGTTVRKATAYNCGWLKDYHIGKGAEIEIIKSGEIIPKIIDVIKPSAHFKLIDHCPCCDFKLEWKKDEVNKDIELICNSPYCMERSVKLVSSFLSKLDVIGVSEKSLENWNIFDFNSLIGFKPNPSLKSQMNFYDELNKKVFSKSLETLMASLYYEGSGRKKLNKIFDFYGYENFVVMIYENEEFTKFPNTIGLKTIEKIKKTWAKNWLIVDSIISDTRYCYIEDKKNNTKNKLSGLSFCFTGKISKPRKEYEADIKDNGGEIKGVSKNLNYLVVGEKAGSKLSKAKNLGVAILSENDFKNLFTFESR